MRRSLSGQDSAGVAANLGNVFEQVLKIDECEAIKREMMVYGALGACMTGSGTTVFGIFNDMELAKQCAFTLKKLYKSTYVTHAAGCGCEIISEN